VPADRPRARIGERQGGLRDEPLRQADASQGQADCAPGGPAAEREALQAAAAQVVYVEVSQVPERRIGREAAPDEARLLGARQDPDREAGRRLCPVQELPRVRGVADGACRDGDDPVRAEAPGLGREARDGGNRAADRAGVKAGAQGPQASADAHLEHPGRLLDQAPAGAPGRDKELYRVASYVDDGDSHGSARPRARRRRGLSGA